MFKYLATIILALGVYIPPVIGAELTPREAAELMGKSVAAITIGGDTICSSSKIGPSQFLTAEHCVDPTETITLQTGQIFHIKSVLMAQQKKKDGGAKAGNRHEDWAILNTVEDDPKMPSLVLACKEEKYLGQAVAYAGFPTPEQYTFGTGHVTSLKAAQNEANGADFMMDAHAAPGASGSAVISMDTGQVIGILTEGITAERAGAWNIGLESVTNLDACDAVTTVAPAGLGTAKPTTDSDDSKIK